MPSLYPGSPAATTVIATRRFPRPENTLNDELMLAIEALMHLLPRYWHKAKGLEELLKAGGASSSGYTAVKRLEIYQRWGARVEYEQVL